MSTINVSRPGTVPVGYAERYSKHHLEPGNRLRTALERRALRRALRLAGYPARLLDLPCGTGRFWPTLAACSRGELLAGDVDDDMLIMAQRQHPSCISRRFRTFATSALEIDLPDNSIDAVVSMRFMHHLANAEDRLCALGEMARVARHAVIVSLWTDRSLSAWWQEGKSRRNLMEHEPGYGRRICLPARLFEWESRQCGMEPLGHFDALPGLNKWRVYTLGVSRSLSSIR